MSRSPNVLTGDVAERYHVADELGRGGTAIVYRARDRARGIDVAIKIMRDDAIGSLSVERFLTEIRRTSQLPHPHIVPVMDSGEHEGRPFFVLPYMDGGTLRNRIKRHKQLPFEDVISLGVTIAGALEFAHTHGVIHRDVKPENILFNNGQPCLADFGTARALERAANDPTTSTGVVRGTPAYMSPEQASGDPDYDHRTDIYSLACVLYETVAGIQPFVGPTTQAVIAQRLLHSPRPVSVYRPSVPVELEQVLVKATAMSPADRYQTASEFARALEEVVPALSRPRITPSGVDSVKVARRRRVLVGAVAAVAIAAVVATWVKSRGPALDAGVYVVAPFSVRGQAAPLAIDGTSSATLAYDALRRWPDIVHVDPLRVNDLLSRSGNSTPTLASALDLAQVVRAANLLWGEIYERAGKTVIRGVVYDVAKPDKPLREATVTLSSTADDSISVRFAALVDTLVANGQPRPSAGSTHPYAAVRQYAEGVSALNRWNLPDAQRSFRSALETEADYPAASLRFAQVSQWLRAPSADWRSAAMSAAGSQADLSPREQLHANALLAMAKADYPTACQYYGRLAAEDRLDFAAWFGLGDCRREDRLVIRDSVSPSGWRFRSSRHATAQAYLRAFELVPTSYRAYRDMIDLRLETTFITTEGEHRTGNAADRSEGTFAAFPELSSDTIAFVPYRFTDVTQGLHRPRADAVTAALERARAQIEELASRWVKATPDSPDAWEIRALALEKAGVIVGQSERSALGSVAKARKFATDSTMAQRLAIAEVRLRLKAADFVSARQLADSTLARWPDPTPNRAAALASLAGLVGDLPRMERLAVRGAPEEQFRRPDGTVFRPSPPLAALALRSVANAVLGGPRDTLAALEQRIETYLASIPNVADRGSIRETLLRNAAMFAFPVYGASRVHAESGGGYLIALQSGLSRGDTARVHRDLLALSEQRKAAGVAPGIVSVDAAYLEAQMLVQLGDSANAVARLDDVLDHLFAQRDWFRDLHGPAMLVSAIDLRATLASHYGDMDTARRWRAAVSALRDRPRRAP